MSSMRIGSVVAVAVMAVAPAALASGMGGGGGGGMPSFTAPQYNPVQEYQDGMAAYQAGKFKDAAGHFQNVTEAAPRHAQSWYMLGMARSGEGDLKGAEKSLTKSARLDPKSLATLRDLSVTQAKLKETDKAGAGLVELKARATACGDACPEATDLKAAIAAVEQAMGMGAPSAEAPLHGDMKFALLDGGDLPYVRAVSLINEHRFPEALTALQAAERSFGPHPDILTYEGYVWRKMGHLDLAEQFYKAALAQAPTHRGATEYYGELKVLRGDKAGARKLLATLESTCAYGCAEAEDLRRWIQHGGDPAS